MRKIKLLSSPIGIGITTGIIASIIFTAIFQPLLYFLGDSFIALVSKFSTNFNDSIYKSAATSSIDWIIIDIYSKIALLFALGLGIFAGTVSSLINKYKSITTHENQADSSQKDIKKIYRKFSLTSTFVIILIGFFTFKLQINYNKAVHSQELIEAYTIRTAIIAPYIDEKERLLIHSKWVQMKSEQDYIKINKDIEKLAALENIILPDLPNK